MHAVQITWARKAPGKDTVRLGSVVRLVPRHRERSKTKKTEERAASLHMMVLFAGGAGPAWRAAGGASTSRRARRRTYGESGTQVSEARRAGGGTYRERAHAPHRT